LLQGLPASGPDDPAGAQDPRGLQRQLARRAARPEDEHRLAGLEVTAVVQRHPSGQPGDQGAYRQALAWLRIGNRSRAGVAPDRRMTAARICSSVG
jgi:hypothetical protein